MDELLTCSDCRTQFTFTAGEQSFYAERGYQKPRRCKTCRAKRKAVNAPAAASAPPTVQWTNGGTEDEAAYSRPRRRPFGKQNRRDNAY